MFYGVNDEMGVKDARSQKPEARSQKPEARSQQPDGELTPMSARKDRHDMAWHGTGLPYSTSPSSFQGPYGVLLESPTLPYHASHSLIIALGVGLKHMFVVVRSILHAPPASWLAAAYSMFCVAPLPDAAAPLERYRRTAVINLASNGEKGCHYGHRRGKGLSSGIWLSGIFVIYGTHETTLLKQFEAGREHIVHHLNFRLQMDQTPSAMVKVQNVVAPLMTVFKLEYRLKLFVPVRLSIRATR
ncbi:hypothetical protein AC579_8816 [Pseudocercospora musae]|uniref:Uncharacterized protein n=1 Tax=Pseudocercospora musae TaxID=113226 RepID=A0A139I561_9PEZI|nr:hypothetical protein AC579_8816 [Pseudocercospora musae]